MANAVETYKALEVLETSANELDKLFKLVNSGMATDADKLMLRQQVAFHGLIQKGVKGIQTETARALAVFRIPRDGNAQVIRQVLEEYGGDGALQDMARSAKRREAGSNYSSRRSLVKPHLAVWRDRLADRSRLPEKRRSRSAAWLQPPAPVPRSRGPRRTCERD